jgi:hypothetical protein
VPVALYHPRRGLGRVTSVCPTPELGPGEGVAAGIDGLAPTGTVIGCPTPDDGVARTDPLALGPGPGAAHEPSELRAMLLDVGLGRFDPGFLPAALAARMFARLVLASPVLAAVKPQQRTPWVFSCAGVTDVALGLMQGQAALCEPQTQKRLTRREAATVLMEDHAVIRVRADTGLRVDLGAGLVHAMQGSQGQQGGNAPPVWRVPAAVGAPWPSSRTPAGNPALRCWRMAGEAGVLASKASWVRRSKHLAMSTLSPSWGRKVSRWKRASMASQHERPGRKP